MSNPERFYRQHLYFATNWKPGNVCRVLQQLGFNTESCSMSEVRYKFHKDVSESYKLAMTDFDEDRYQKFNNRVGDCMGSSSYYYIPKY